MLRVQNQRAVRYEPSVELFSGIPITNNVIAGSSANSVRAGVRGATFNLVAGDGSSAYDGISELWFDDQAAFEAAYATDHGRAVAADSMAHVSRRERLFVAEHVLVPHH